MPRSLLLDKDDPALWEGHKDLAPAADPQPDGRLAEAPRPIHLLPLRPAKIGHRAARVRPGSEHVGQGTEMLNNSRGEVLEERDELPAHPDARETRIGVARILGEGERVPVEVGQHVLPAGEQERPDQGGALGPRSARRQDRKPPRTRSTKQAEKERLGPIVGGVPRRDDRSESPRRSAAKGLEAGCASASLQVRAGFDLNPGDLEGYPCAFRHLLRQGELSRRLRSEAVIDAMGDQPVTDALAEQGKDMEKRRRVRPAGAGAEHDIAAPKERLVTDDALAAAKQRGRVRSPGPRPGALSLRVSGRAAHQSSNALQKIT